MEGEKAFHPIHTLVEWMDWKAGKGKTYPPLIYSSFYDRHEKHIDSTSLRPPADYLRWA
jgi:hypothetical protein